MGSACAALVREPHAASLLLVYILACAPAHAVRVWNLGDNFVQPPGTPRGRPQLIISGMGCDPINSPYGNGRYLTVRVMCGNGEFPVARAMVYLVRKLNVPETVVFNTDENGDVTIGDIEDCWRELVVSDGFSTVRQWVSIPGHNISRVVVYLPHSGEIRAFAPPFKCAQYSFYAVRNCASAWHSVQGIYQNARAGIPFSLKLPPGVYSVYADAYDKDWHKQRQFIWRPVVVEKNKTTTLGPPRHEVKY